MLITKYGESHKENNMESNTYFWLLEPGDGTRYTLYYNETEEKPNEVVIGIKVGDIFPDVADRPFCIAVLNTAGPITMEEIKALYPGVTNNQTLVVLATCIRELTGRMLCGLEDEPYCLCQRYYPKVDGYIKDFIKEVFI